MRERTANPRTNIADFRGFEYTIHTERERERERERDRDIAIYSTLLYSTLL